MFRYVFLIVSISILLTFFNMEPTYAGSLKNKCDYYTDNITKLFLRNMNKI